jgi:serine phosphatase RsbU (regulator of sigma subunit)
MSVLAVAVFILRFFPFFRRNANVLGIAVESYLQIATGILTGLTGADPSYVGGYLFIIMITLIAPIKLYQNYIILYTSVAGFAVTSLLKGVDFTSGQFQYSIRDLALTLLVASIFYYIIDRFRRQAFEKSKQLEEERNKLNARNILIEKELSMARTLQENLIPSENPVKWIASIYTPMDQFGGDFFDFVLFADSRKVGIFLSDVSGHGVPAAFITSMLKSFILQAGDIRKDPAGLMTYLNLNLARQTGSHFVTAFYGIFDPDDRSLLFSNAGHPMPLVIHDSAVYQLSRAKGGAPLATLDNNELTLFGRSFKNTTVTFDPGSKILLFTDGLIEAEKSAGQYEEFEDNSLYGSLVKYQKKSPFDFITNIYNDLVVFRGSDSFQDDVCIICIGT